jgi:type II secretory pathway component PulJ
MLCERLRREESGFTLVELMVATLVSTFVILGAMQLLDNGVKQSRRVSDRIDSAQSARAGLFAMTRQLRSQVCLGPATPAIIGDGTATNSGDYNIRFYNFTGDPAQTYRPKRRQFSYDATARTITETIWTPDAATTFPALTYTGAPQTRIVARDVIPTQSAGVDVPIFRYYSYPASGTLTPSVQLAAPLSAVNAANAVMVRLAFVARPSRPGNRAARANAPTTTITDDVISPTADPNGIGGAGPGECG